VKVLNPADLRIPSEPGDTACLLGGRCRQCGYVVFPKMPVCPACRCNGTIEEIEIGRTGKIYSHTIAHVAPQGFSAPFFQIFVDLPEGPRIFALVGSKCPVESGAIEDGMEMRLVLEAVADTPGRADVLTYKYVPAHLGGSA
jgi:uncharacterized OB-fold protein